MEKQFLEQQLDILILEINKFQEKGFINRRIKNTYFNRIRNDEYNNLVKEADSLAFRLQYLQ